MNEQDEYLKNLSTSDIHRFQLIEIIAYWEGRLTTNHLGKVFQLGRQQASRFINQYISELAPNNLEYDQSLKGYKATEGFRPIFTQGRVDEYLNLLKINQSLISKNNYTALQMREINSISPPPRFIKPAVMRVIGRAIAENKEVEVEYISLENIEPKTIIISPHSLIESPLRWHVRAYCEERKSYRDFILSRFINEPKLLSGSIHHIEDDKNWCAFIDILLVPNIVFSENQKIIIEQDYDMKNGELVIPTRLALVKYTLASLGIDINNENESSNMSLIMLKDKEKLKWNLMSCNA